jgi:response regulator RpfG family c-di-GMP phosphodiesterase
MIRTLLDQMLEIEGHSCDLAENSEEARNHLKTKNYELLLCDIKLPGESGMDFIKYVTADYKDTATIIVSGINDTEVAKSALRRGIYDYIMKPVTINRLSVSVANALRRRQLEIANRTYKEDLERMIVERTAKLQKTLDGIVRTIALTVESRDPYTAGHQKRVADLACFISQECGLSEEQIEGIRMAGTIHDLGKISVPAEVLSKPSQLSQNEFNLIKDHPQVGFDILKEIEFPWPIAEIVLQHHERFDGSGYPQGLSGDEILIEARILAVADVVEAMASHRPYRPGKGLKKALAEIANHKGTSYDPDAVDACLKVFKQKKFTIE